MRILLDECVPKPLKREFTDFNLKTVQQMGWSGTKNGALLNLMSQAELTVLLTSDQNIKYEQNLKKGSRVSIVIRYSYYMGEVA